MTAGGGNVFTITYLFFVGNHIQWEITFSGQIIISYETSGAHFSNSFGKTVEQFKINMTSIYINYQS